MGENGTMRTEPSLWRCYGLAPEKTSDRVAACASRDDMENATADSGELSRGNGSVR